MKGVPNPVTAITDYLWQLIKLKVFCSDRSCPCSLGNLGICFTCTAYVLEEPLLCRFQRDGMKKTIQNRGQAQHCTQSGLRTPHSSTPEHGSWADTTDLCLPSLWRATKLQMGMYSWDWGGGKLISALSLEGRTHELAKVIASKTNLAVHFLVLLPMQ